MDVDTKYVFTTTEESVREKDWAAGSSKRLDSLEYLFRPDFTCELRTVKSPPALNKIVDEPIVNALDHVERCRGSKEPVSYIKIVFDRTGWVKISNDGPGVDVAIHKTASEKLGRETWAPTFIFGTLFQGSNRKKTEDSIIGGTNGIGAKLSNCFSTEFIVETTDTARGLYFVQKWRGGMKECDPPTIVPLNDPKLTADKKRAHTTIAFLPDYSFFGYEYPLTQTDYNDLNGLFLTRAIFASAYANFGAGKKRVATHYNGVLLPFHSMTDIANAMFPGAVKVSTTVIPGKKVPRANKKAADGTTSKSKKVVSADVNAASAGAKSPLTHPWEVCVVLTASKLSEMSNVNGVVVRAGKHTKYLLDQIAEVTKEKIAKLFNEREVKFSSQFISNNIFLLINARIPNPAWSGQRKDHLDYDTKRFRVYQFDQKVVKELSETLHARCAEEIFNKLPAATGRKKTTVDYDKYRRADLAGTRESSKCILIPVEGDSAMNHIRTGISESVGFSYIGVISTGGVIMNARTKSEVTRVGDGQYIHKNEQLENNKFFTAFCAIVGLNHHYKYAVGSPTYKREIAELQYGAICVFVDQDLDGKGNILGSFISMFEYWWPELLRAGFVKWFCSPIIRAYPTRGGTILEFYSVPEYEKWIETRGCSKDAEPPGYSLRYYKGIGTHSREEIIRTFRQYQKSVLTYTVDARTSRLFHVYFGSEPDLRKEELSKPTTQPSPEQTLAQYRTQTISCSDHLLWETNPYQKDNLERKLDHVIDGQNQSGRKILDGILKAFGVENKRMKVAVLAGFISERENYHHGEESLAKSITKKGFIGPGGKQLPPLFPCSNFGSRAQGGDDASPPRYIYAKNNVRLNSLLYPRADYYLLEFNFDEGTRSEPKYFVPIIPVVVCESTEVPAHGWKIKTWARDVFTVMDNVQRQIRLGAECPLLPMRPAKYDPAPYNWTGEFRDIRGKLHSIGSAEVISQGRDGATVHMKSAPSSGWVGTYDPAATYYVRITELPLREWTIPYIAKIKKKALGGIGMTIIAPCDIIDSSNDRRINILVTLQPGAMGILQTLNDTAYASGIEEFFCLRDHMDDHLNFMGADGAVVSLGDYADAMRIWFPVRRKYYEMRIDRELLLLKLELRKLENVIRYVQDAELKLHAKKLAQMKEMLAAKNYDAINAKKLSSPKFTPTTELTELILGPSATYDYLLDLSDKSKSEEKLVEYRAKYEELQAEIAALEKKAAGGTFRGALIWEEELAELRKVITEGFRTEWKFEEFGKFSFE